MDSPSPLTPSHLRSLLHVQPPLTTPLITSHHPASSLTTSLYPNPTASHNTSSHRLPPRPRPPCYLSHHYSIRHLSSPHATPPLLSPTPLYLSPFHLTRTAPNPSPSSSGLRVAITHPATTSHRTLPQRWAQLPRLLRPPRDARRSLPRRAGGRSARLAVLPGGQVGRACRMAEPKEQLCLLPPPPGGIPISIRRFRRTQGQPRVCDARIRPLAPPSPPPRSTPPRAAALSAHVGGGGGAPLAAAAAPRALTARHRRGGYGESACGAVGGVWLRLDEQAPDGPRWRGGGVRNAGEHIRASFRLLQT